MTGERIDYIGDCEGKTIAGHVSMWNGVGLRFTDDSWWLGRIASQYGEDDFSQYASADPDDLLQLGVIDAAECSAMKAAEIAADEAKERALYERLKAKYGRETT